MAEMIHWAVRGYDGWQHACRHLHGRHLVNTKAYWEERTGYRPAINCKKCIAQFPPEAESVHWSGVSDRTAYCGVRTSKQRITIKNPQHVTCKTCRKAPGFFKAILKVCERIRRAA